MDKQALIEKLNSQIKSHGRRIEKIKLQAKTAREEYELELAQYKGEIRGVRSSIEKLEALVAELEVSE